MRVLVVHPGPHFSVADVYNGVVKGLRENGHDVATLNLDDRLEFYTQTYIKRPDDTFVKALEGTAAFEMAAQGIEVACYEYWPDMVIIMSGWFVPPKVWGVLARRPHHVVYWCTESPYEDDRQSGAARYADTVILNDPVNLHRFVDEINVNTHYLPHSYDPDVHYVGPADPELECDFAFTGTGFESRIRFFEAVDWGDINARFGGNWKFVQPDSPISDFLIHGPDQCMPNHITADLYRSAKVGANMYRKEHSEAANAEGWAMGPREVEMAACGLFFLREPRGEGDEVFPMLPTFTDTDTFIDLLRHYLDHPDERAELAAQARAAIADRTFQNTTAELVRLVQDQPCSTIPA